MKIKKNQLVRIVQECVSHYLIEAAMKGPKVNIDGVVGRWQQRKRSTDRMAVGEPSQNIQPFNLELSNGDHIYVMHTDAIAPYVQRKEPPAWKIRVRINNKDLVLKYREPDPEYKGTGAPEIVTKVLDKAVQSYKFLKNKEEASNGNTPPLPIP